MSNQLLADLSRYGKLNNQRVSVPEDFTYPLFYRLKDQYETGAL